MELKVGDYVLVYSVDRNKKVVGKIEDIIVSSFLPL